MESYDDEYGNEEGDAGVEENNTFTQSLDVINRNPVNTPPNGVAQSASAALPTSSGRCGTWDEFGSYFFRKIPRL